MSGREQAPGEFISDQDLREEIARLRAQLDKAEAVVRAAEEHGKVIQRKCEQYWNEPIPEAPEFHAILEFIHHEVAAYRERT